MKFPSQTLSRRSFSASTNSHLPEWFRKSAYTNEYNLPRLPIPSLEETIEKYLKSVEPLASKEEFEKHAVVAKDFMHGSGAKLHKMLVSRDSSIAPNQYPYSYIEKDWDTMYLGGRYPSPINVNPGYGLIKETNSSLKPILPRISSFLTSLMKWHNKVRTGKLEPDKAKSIQCMSTFATQLGTARKPQTGKDRWSFSPESNHIVVLRKNKFFRVNVLSPDLTQLVSAADLEGFLEQIIDVADRSSNQDPNVSVLTAGERDSWARTHHEIVQFDTMNASSMETIDSALMMVVLDDRSTTDSSTKSALTLHGFGKDRWFDKHQVIAYDDGHIGINFEHSFSDGTAWNRFLHEVWMDMHPEQGSSGFSPLPTLPQYKTKAADAIAELKWSLPPSAKKDISTTEEKFSELYKGTATNLLEFSDFGKNRIKTFKQSPDAFVQMALQLAFYRLHGEIPPTYEACATRSFLHGRTETIRSASNEASSFVRGMAANASSSAQNKQLCEQAMSKHLELAKAASRGMGVDRHIFAMSSIASEAENAELNHAFFSEALRVRGSHFRVSSSNVTMPFLDYFCFGAVVADGYGAGYLIQDNHIPMNLTCFEGHTTDVDAFGKEFSKALNDMDKLFSQ